MSKIIIKKSTEKSLPSEIIDGQLLFDKDGYIAWDTVKGSDKKRIIARAKELGTSTVGSQKQSIYLDQGRPVAGVDLSSSVAADDVALGTPILPPGITKIPTHLSDLQSDSNHMTVSQVEKDNWNSKSGNSSGGGTLDHTLLINRNEPNQHSIDAISGLKGALNDKISQKDLQPTINEALQTAKDRGDFKGDPGKTPQKGVDYWTEQDKNEIIQQVLALLPKWDGGGTY